MAPVRRHGRLSTAPAQPIPYRPARLAYEEVGGHAGTGKTGGPTYAQPGDLQQLQWSSRTPTGDLLGAIHQLSRGIWRQRIAICRDFATRHNSVQIGGSIRIIGDYPRFRHFWR